MTWLLGHQASDGSWGGFLLSYSTGLALLAFSDTAARDQIPAAVAKGLPAPRRTQNASPSVTGNTGAQGVPGPTPECSSDKGSATAATAVAGTTTPPTSAPTSRTPGSR